MQDEMFAKMQLQFKELKENLAEMPLDLREFKKMLSENPLKFEDLKKKIRQCYGVLWKIYATFYG